MEKKKGYSATVRFVLIAPSKVRRIADHLRKKPYVEAMAILEALPHKGARILKKLLKSAASNAIYQNKKLEEDMLYIQDLQVNDGPRMKRIWPRARRKADIWLRRSSHVSVVMNELTQER
jgi:large subunit ribosomal protein L22